MWAWDTKDCILEKPGGRRGPGGHYAALQRIVPPVIWEPMQLNDLQGKYNER